MDIYAIRKNKCAGVYTEKEVFEYIKDTEQKCSIRIFKKGEENEAMKWAGVTGIDKIPSILKADEAFNKILKKGNAVPLTDNKNKKDTNNINTDGLHRTKGFTDIESSEDVKPKEKMSVINPVASSVGFVDKIIDKYKKAYPILMIRTKSFGDIYYLSDLWYYEKAWDIEYAYDLTQLIEYGYIECRKNTSLKNKNGFYEVKNVYRLKSKTDALAAEDLLVEGEKMLLLNVDEFRGVEPISGVLMEWEVSGELKEFISANNKAKEIKEYLNSKDGKDTL